MFTLYRVAFRALHFRDRRGATSLRYKTRAEIPFLCVNKRFSCRRKSYLVQFEHCLNVRHLESFLANFLFSPLFSSFTSANQTGSNKERKIKERNFLTSKKELSSSLDMSYIYPGFYDADCAGIPGTRDSSHFPWILYSGFQSLVCVCVCVGGGGGGGSASFTCI